MPPAARNRSSVSVPTRMLSKALPPLVVAAFLGSMHLREYASKPNFVGLVLKSPMMTCVGASCVLALLAS